MFKPDPAFDAGSEAVADLILCQARLQLDGRYPWLILIPRQASLVEIEDLSAVDRVQLLDEALAAGSAVRALGAAWGRPVEKLNIAQLGNITRQLHVHVIGRRSDDAAWPNPVWGLGSAQALSDDELAASKSVLLKSLGPIVAR